MFDYFANINWTETWSVVLVGLVVVFSVLLILVAICWVMGKIFSALTGGKNSGAQAGKNSEAASAPAVKKEAASPVVEDGISDEIVAAISAAVACMMGSGKPFALKSVRRAKELRKRPVRFNRIKVKQQ